MIWMQCQQHYQMCVFLENWRMSKHTFNFLQGQMLGEFLICCQMLIAGKMNCQLHTLNWWREKGWGCKMEKFLFSRKYFFIQINTFKSSLWVGGKQKLGGKMEKSKLSCQILEKKGEKTKLNGEIQIKESRRSAICKVSFTIPRLKH